MPAATNKQQQQQQQKQQQQIPSNTLAVCDVSFVTNLIIYCISRLCQSLKTQSFKLWAHYFTFMMNWKRSGRKPGVTEKKKIISARTRRMENSSTSSANSSNISASSANSSLTVVTAVPTVL